MEYLDFDLSVEPAAGGGYDVAVVGSPAGEARAQMAFPYDQLVLKNKIQALQIALLRSGGTRRAATAAEDQEAVQLLGRDLFAALFSGDVANRLDISRTMARTQGKGVRIKLRFGAPELGALPWEYLYDSNKGDYLALGISTPIVRYLPIPQPIMPFEVAPPLRVLAMASGPRDLGVLDSQRERQRLELALDPLRSAGIVELEWVRGESWQDLQESLWHGPWHIFHFVGHGGFNERLGSGVLYLTGADGNADQLSATDLARLLGDHDPLRLALLNSCETAQGASTDIFSSTAAALVRFGTPAVVAMQFQITDDAAIEFSRVFYSTISQGMPVDSAVAEARKSVALKSHSYEWGTPVLFMRSPDGRLFNIPRDLLRRRAAPIEQAVEAVASVAATAATSQAVPATMDATPAAVIPVSPTVEPPIAPQPLTAPPSTDGLAARAPAAVPAAVDPVADAARRRRRRRWLIAGAGAAVLLVVGVIAAPYIRYRFFSPAFHFMTLSPTVGPPGTTVTAKVDGFASSAQVAFMWADSAEAQVVQADAKGDALATLIVPADLPQQLVDIVARDASSGSSGRSSFLVRPGPLDIDTYTGNGPFPTSATGAPLTPTALVDRDVANAVCQIQIQAPAASTAGRDIRSWVSYSNMERATIAYQEMDIHIQAAKQSLLLAGTWQPLVGWAPEFRTALDEYQGAYAAYLGDKGSSTLAAIDGKVARLNELYQELDQVLHLHPELGRVCWPPP
jgi:hypothetical protein